MESSGTSCYFFFFQAEDGIRDIGVTGVQTCALPISQRIYQQMPLSAAELLRPIVTPNTAHAGGLHRLGVEDARTRLGIATSARARSASFRAKPRGSSPYRCRPDAIV